MKEARSNIAANSVIKRTKSQLIMAELPLLLLIIGGRELCCHGSKSNTHCGKQQSATQCGTQQSATRCGTQQSATQCGTQQSATDSRSYSIRSYTGDALIERNENFMLTHNKMTITLL